MNGSTRSFGGIGGDVCGGAAGDAGWLKGWEERSRMACVIVGWKRPPNLEYAARCVGRVWPSMKNVDVKLARIELVVLLTEKMLNSRIFVT